MIHQVNQCATVGDSLQPFMQNEKSAVKEAVCQQVIVDQPQKQSVEPLECDTTTHLVKAKNVRARKLMEKPKIKVEDVPIQKGDTETKIAEQPRRNQTNKMGSR
jgi:hypothetical protein